MADRRLNYSVGSTDDFSANMKRAAQTARKSMKDVQSDLDATGSKGKQLAQVLSAMGDKIENELDDIARTAEILGRSLPEDEAKRFAQMLNQAGISADELGEDAQDLIQQMQRLDQAATRAGTELRGSMDDAGDGVRRLGENGDQTKSVLANMAGNSAQDLGELGGVAGSAGVMIGQLAEYATEGNISLANLAKVAGPMALLAIGVTAVTKTMESLNKRQQKWDEDTRDLTKSIIDGADASQSLAERMTETGRVMATVTTENNFGEWLVSMGDEASKGEADVTDALDRLGMTVQQFSNLAAGSGEGIMTWRQGMTDAGLAGDDLTLVNNALWASWEQVQKAAQGAAVMHRIGAGALEVNTEAIERATDATDANREALEALNDAQDAALDNNINLAEAMLDTADALDEYSATMDDAEASDRDKQRAGLNLISTMQAEADAAGRSAEDQARAAGRSSSAVQEGVAAQVATLHRLAGELAPGSYLRNQIEGHIRALGSIPRNIDTTIRVTGTGTGAQYHPVQGSNGARVPVMDTGGVIPGPTGAPVPMIGHAGEIVLNAAQQANAASAMIGGGGAPTVVQVILDGRVLVDALVRQGRINGPLPIVVQGSR